MYIAIRCDKDKPKLADANECERFDDVNINQLMLWIKASLFDGQYRAIHVLHIEEGKEIPNPWEMTS